MKTLVIHPTDASTDFLAAIYSDKEDWTIINNEVLRDHLKQKIMEHDRIVLLGHGSPYGLFGFGGYVIDESFGELLATKKCINIWCHAVYYAMRHRLNGFFTEMFISETLESWYCNVRGTEQEIEYSNKLFGEAIRDLVERESFIDPLKRIYRSDTNEIIRHNHNKLYEKDFAEEQFKMFAA